MFYRPSNLPEKIIQTKDIQKLVRMQTEFLQSQMQALGEQVKDLGEPVRPRGEISAASNQRDRHVRPEFEPLARTAPWAVDGDVAVVLLDELA